MSFQLDPNFKASFRQAVSDQLELAAKVGDEQLTENLSETTGSGEHWAGLPNRSSAPDEYPVRQSGALHAGVGWQPTSDPLRKEVFIADDEDKLIGLEFSPPSDNPNREGAPKRDAGGRAPMWRTFSDPRTHERMARRMESDE